MEATAPVVHAEPIPAATTPATKALPANPDAHLVERVVLNRKAREVSFYLRKNTFKKCIHNLSDDQVKTLLRAIQKTGKDIVDTLSLADETFIVSPKTKKSVK